MRGEERAVGTRPACPSTDRTTPPHPVPTTSRRTTPTTTAAHRGPARALGRALALAALVGSLLAGLLAAVGPVATASAAGTLEGFEVEVVRLHNQARRAAGLAPLDVHVTLHTDSRDWSQEMARRQALAHETSSTSDGHFADSCAATGTWTRCAENVAMGYSSPAAVHDGWMRSSGHRANILKPDHNRVGVGVWRDGQGRLWWTARFMAGTRTDTADSTRHPQDGSSGGYDPDSADGTVYRLYLAYFLREPDREGYAYWRDAYRSGYPLASISDDFARSREFRALYGSVGDDDFVRLVYENVLGRQPDSGGLQYWRQKMAEGMPRGHVMIYFSDSREFREATADGRPPI